jgi:hypothetical protein
MPYRSSEPEIARQLEEQRELLAIQREARRRRTRVWLVVAALSSCAFLIAGVAGAHWRTTPFHEYRCHGVTITYDKETYDHPMLGPTAVQREPRSWRACH